MPAANSLDDFAQNLAASLLEKSAGHLPVWPDTYSDLTGDTAFKFLTECWWTLDEAGQRIALVPPKEYIEKVCHEWVTCFATRKPLVIEKSRRLLLSWVCRGLETWALGIKRGESLIVDQKHENSAEHLWRIHFALQELRRRNPRAMHSPHDARGAIKAKQASHVILPNGSIMTQAHQDAGAMQGQGKTMVVLEELSKYRDPQGYWAQALLITMGAAGEDALGGWVMGIANPTPNPDWSLVKQNVVAREALGFE